jgi:hypothetical protein
MTRPLALMFAFILIAVTAIAQEQTAQQSLGDPLALRKLRAFTTDRYSSALSDAVYTNVMLSDGSVFIYSLFHLKIGLIDRWGAYMVIARPDGSMHWVSESIPKRLIQPSSDSMSVYYGEYGVTDMDTQFDIVCAIDNIRVDLTLKNRVSPWMRDDDGMYQLSEDAFQQRIIFSPWAEVSGTISIDGVTNYVTGEGVGEKILIVCDLNRLTPVVVGMVLFGEADPGVSNQSPATRYHINLYDIIAHPSFDSIRFPRLLVGKDDEWLFTTETYEIEFREYIPAPGFDYEYPVRVGLSAHGNGFSLSGEFTAQRLYNTMDILAELPAWLRGVAKVFIDRPVYFRNVGVFNGTITHPDGTREDVSLRGTYDYIVVN